MTLNLEMAQPLIVWANEREAIRLRKAVLERSDSPDELPQMSHAEEMAWGMSPLSQYPEPGLWTLDQLTADPILGKFRFCNVRREDDRVTVWIRENIREPYAEHEHLWFMLAIARQINWPETLAELISQGETGCHCWPLDEWFDPKYMTNGLLARQARGDKVYGAAYMIRAEQHDHPWRYWPKVRYTAEIVLGKLWERREDWQHLNGPGSDTLEGIWQYFQDPYFTGWGPFLAGQVVTDLRWTRYLENAPDIQTWTALGPGSKRGLNRLHGRPLEHPLRQEQGLQEMLELRELLKQPGALAPWLEVPDLSDCQNALCETDKMLRARSGEGRPKSNYVPGRGS